MAIYADKEKLDKVISQILISFRQSVWIFLLPDEKSLEPNSYLRRFLRMLRCQFSWPANTVFQPLSPFFSCFKYDYL